MKPCVCGSKTFLRDRIETTDLTTAHKDHNAMATNDDDDEDDKDDKDDVRTGRMIYAFCYSCFGIHAIS